MAADEDWRADLDGWLQPFLTALSHPARRAICPLYVAGLIGAGERKSVQPMAARGEGISYDRLHHFIAAGLWNEAPLERALLAEADRLVGGPDAILVVDDTALPKKGDPDPANWPADHSSGRTTHRGADHILGIAENRTMP